MFGIQPPRFRARRLQFETFEPRLPFDAAWATISEVFHSEDASHEQDLVSAEMQPRIVTVDSPNNHLVGSGEFSGVAMLHIRTLLGRFTCSASLIDDRHVLTAAHCVTGFFGRITARSITAEFPTATGVVSAFGSQVFVHPAYSGRLHRGNDIAIIRLASNAANSIDRYDIYRDSDEVGKVGTKVGYGLTGTGNTGATIDDDRLRVGQNRYDADASRLNPLLPLLRQITPGNQLAYDFDNGLAANDAFGRLLGIHDLGLGTNEVNSAPGDSGGPTFINGKIAGVTSWGIGLGVTDVTVGTDSSFGEFSIDTRVSVFQSWVDSILAGGTSSANNVTQSSAEARSAAHEYWLETIVILPDRVERSSNVVDDSTREQSRLKSRIFAETADWILSLPAPAATLSEDLTRPLRQLDLTQDDIEDQQDQTALAIADSVLPIDVVAPSV